MPAYDQDAIVCSDVLEHVEPRTRLAPAWRRRYGTTAPDAIFIARPTD